jgi:hypothetical protein
VDAGTVRDQLGNAAWIISLDYRDNNDNPQTDTWVPPPIGGTFQDPAPPQGRTPAPGSPPDPTLFGGAYDTSQNPPTDQWLYRRFSTLPVGGIVLAISTNFNGVGVSATINADPIGPGNFVSNYMAYLVAWYQDWWSDHNVDSTKRCRCAGHTHVGNQVSVPDAAAAVAVQLGVLIEFLNYP